MFHLRVRISSFGSLLYQVVVNWSNGVNEGRTDETSSMVADVDLSALLLFHTSVLVHRRQVAWANSRVIPSTQTLVYSLQLDKKLSSPPASACVLEVCCLLPFCLRTLPCYMLEAICVYTSSSSISISWWQQWTACGTPPMWAAKTEVMGS